ncbi:MAG: 30S ribosome-binding factor RbfA [Bryobacteraceae bacterium]|nr:30S ribosome-binding factor RbfA [Bryobacteraceae bacterium]MDW8379197.1 30S ribosome-binding factor RbfA [Bryobacterales bacterium]
MDPHRRQRVEEALRAELTELVALELEDPRLQGLAVNQVHLSPDGNLLSVRLSIPGDRQQQRDTLAAMERAKPFLRREIAHRLDLFRVPDLRFEADLSPELSARMEYLFKRIRKGRPRQDQPEAEILENSTETS